MLRQPPVVVVVARRRLLAATRPPCAGLAALASTATLAPGRLESEPEYVSSPRYPKIRDMTREARKERQQQAWRDKVTSLPTIEQKMMEVNMPKYYGYWSCQLPDSRPVLGGAPFCQFATRTRLTRQPPPPQYYASVQQRAAAAADNVAPQVEDLIRLHFHAKINRRIKDSPAALRRHRAENFLQGLNRVMCGGLQDTPHIREAKVDVRPRVESYWVCGSLPPDNMRKKTRRGLAWLKHTEDDPMERPMQGVSRPCVGVRVEWGLPAVVGRSEGEVEQQVAGLEELPAITVDPRCFGFRFRHKHATTVTASWPSSEGCRRQHGHLFLHTLAFEDRFRRLFGDHNLPDALTHKAVLATFTQAHAHTTYLGFGAVTELTYPIVQQSAFSDGQRWFLGLYQLNTCALHSDRPVNNPYCNVLWLSEEQQLFEDVEEDGRVRGLNTSLLTSLLAMYLKEGVPNPDPSPFLPLQHVANHPASEEYREAFHQFYLWLCSGRERHTPRPEIYLWEKIYKVDFKTRAYEPPRRFFEDHYLKQDPGQRKLDEYRPPYIPKALRAQKKPRRKPVIHTEHLYTYD